MTWSRSLPVGWPTSRFDRVLDGLFIDRMEGNEEIFSRVMSDVPFRKAVQAHLARPMFDSVRSGLD